MNAAIKSINEHFEAAADLARCNAMVATARADLADPMKLSIEAYEADQRNRPDPSEGRMDDLRDLIGELVAMGVSADAITLAVQSALMMATA